MLFLQDLRLAKEAETLTAEFNVTSTYFNWYQRMSDNSLGMFAGNQGSDGCPKAHSTVTMYLEPYVSTKKSPPDSGKN